MVVALAPLTRPRIQPDVLDRSPPTSGVRFAFHRSPSSPGSRSRPRQEITTIGMAQLRVTAITAVARQLVRRTAVGWPVLRCAPAASYPNARTNWRALLFFPAYFRRQAATQWLTAEEHRLQGFRDLIAVHDEEPRRPIELGRSSPSSVIWMTWRASGHSPLRAWARHWLGTTASCAERRPGRTYRPLHGSCT